MKISTLLTFTFVLLQTINFSQENRKLKAYLDTKQFYAPGVGNYLEVHLQFVGYSVNYKGKDNGLIGDLAVQIAINNEDSVFVNDAYRLESPLMVDSIIDDFYDIQRYALAPGKYTFRIEMFDINSTVDPIIASHTIHIDDLSESISGSDIIIAESASQSDPSSAFYKSGYAIIPKLSTFYPKELSHIPAYAEFYNTQLLQDSVFAIKQTLTNMDSGIEIEEFTSYLKLNTQEVVPFFNNINIENVPTGLYRLAYTVVDRNFNELSTVRYDFERSNDIQVTYNPDEMVIDPAFQESITTDSISFYLASLIPISGPAQVKTILSELRRKDTSSMRKMIQAYWQQTSPVSAYEGWMKYKAEVQKVDRLYSNNFQDGFETDRGRVYLQYGPPSRTFSRETSPSEYPYEIWEYNKIGKFSNKKFIFYNPDLVNNTYRLLHSDMVGELKNPGWAKELAKRNTVNGSVDDPNQYNSNSWGNNSREVFGQ